MRQNFASQAKKVTILQKAVLSDLAPNSQSDYRRVEQSSLNMNSAGCSINVIVTFTCSTQTDYPEIESICIIK